MTEIIIIYSLKSLPERCEDPLELVAEIGIVLDDQRVHNLVEIVDHSYVLFDDFEAENQDYDQEGT